MLTAELTSLPDRATPLLRRFYQDNEAWLTEVLCRSLSWSAARVATLAAAFLAALEGAMMSARAFGDARRLADAAEWLIGQLAASPQAPRQEPARRRTRS
jgi:TetR/AcrR family transcriptional repressor of nem operon